MINDNTIISSFNDRPTLLEWLKKVEEALKSDTATAFHVNNRGNATLTFSIDFANGTSLESEPIVLQKGESVIGAEIRSGHLILTLSNGDELDAGDVKPVNSFLINASQHLIVNYDDGTNQDLGAIFSGNISIDGTITANVIDGLEVTGNEIVEKMSGYSISNKNDNATFNYAGVVKNGNKLTIALFLNIQLTEDLGVNLPFTICYVNLPLAVANKLKTTTIDGVANIVNNQKLTINYSLNNMQEANLITYRFGQTLSFDLSPLETPMLATRNYVVRVEMTFLLSDNLAA